MKGSYSELTNFTQLCKAICPPYLWFAWQVTYEVTWRFKWCHVWCQMGRYPKQEYILCAWLWLYYKRCDKTSYKSKSSKELKDAMMPMRWQIGGSCSWSMWASSSMMLETLSILSYRITIMLKVYHDSKVCLHYNEILSSHAIEFKILIKGDHYSSCSCMLLHCPYLKQPCSKPNCYQSMPITSVCRSWPIQIKSDLWKVPYIWW